MPDDDLNLDDILSGSAGLEKPLRRSQFGENLDVAALQDAVRLTTATSTGTSREIQVVWCEKDALIAEYAARLAEALSADRNAVVPVLLLHGAQLRDGLHGQITFGEEIGTTQPGRTVDHLLIHVKGPIVTVVLQFGVLPYPQQRSIAHWNDGENGVYSLPLASMLILGNHPKYGSIEPGVITRAGCFELVPE
jgi:hypothetical protein